MNKAILSTATLGVLSLSMASLQHEQETPVRVYDANKVRVSALGACDITSQEAQCWDMDGAMDSDLTKRIKAALTSSNQEINFRFGQKNVFLAIDSTGNQVNLSRQPQGYLNTIYLNQNGNSRLQLARINPEDEKGPIVLTGTVGGLPGPAPVDLSATPDSTAKIATVTYTMGTFRVKNNPPVPNRNVSNWNPYGFRAAKEWVVAIGTSDSSNSDGYPQFTPLDKEKKPITYVTRNGEPVSSLKYIETENLNPSQPGYMPNGLPDPKAKVIPAYLQQSQTTIPSAFTLDTDIDPKFIGAYRITMTSSVKFELGPFPIQAH